MAADIFLYFSIIILCQTMTPTLYLYIAWQILSVLKWNVYTFKKKIKFIRDWIYKIYDSTFLTLLYLIFKCFINI